jgi:CheY-like chemotaxis protein
VRRPTPSGKPPRILIVDDEEDVRRIVALALRKLPFAAEIMTAGNGMEALQAVKAERPSLVVLDLMMPQMDGIEVCRRLR